MIKKFFEMYCSEHSCFVLKCSFVCYPAELAFIHISHALLLRMACVAGTDQPMCSFPSAELSKCSAELQQIDVLSSEDTCFSYGPFYSLCLFSLYFNRYTNKEIIHAVQLFTSKR